MVVREQKLEEDWRPRSLAWLDCWFFRFIAFRQYLLHKVAAKRNDGQPNFYCFVLSMQRYKIHEGGAMTKFLPLGKLNTGLAAHWKHWGIQETREAPSWLNSSKDSNMRPSLPVAYATQKLNLIVLFTIFLASKLASVGVLHCNHINKKRNWFDFSPK